MDYAALFIAGVITGAAIVLIVNRSRQKDVEKSFSALSMQALSRNSEEFLKLANQTLSTQAQLGTGQLDEKKKLIDQTLEGIKGELAKVEKSVAEFDAKREKAFGGITEQLKAAAEQTTKLQNTTSQLELALANTRERGQWGERMAEDILRLVGFVENVNYTKQKTQEGIGTRPDYSFYLPNNLQINMDVKFPWDNYRNFQNATTDPDKETYKQKFISDTRKKVKEVSTREYINPKTVDYAILFIPNEQVFCFLHQNDASILEYSLKEKVILCSPITLFAILRLIHQAVEDFTLVQTANESLSLFGTFYVQWSKFTESMDKMGERLRQADAEFEKLTSTRRKALERPLKQIDALRKEKGIPEAPVVEDEAELEEGRQEAAKPEA